MTLDPSAWDVARRAAERSGVSLRPLDRPSDAHPVRSVITAVWGEQVLPHELIRAFQHAGTVLIGAETGDETVGFVFGFPGFEPTLHLHSHMLAVLPEWQSRGVGVALKLAQRALCLDHGVDEVRWTYDPLVARNGWLNLVKLGTEAVRYHREFYGEMRDRLNAGDRTDRFEVRWRLTSDRVHRALVKEAEPPPEGNVLLEAEGEPGKIRPVETGERPGPGSVVCVPHDHLALRMADPELGLRWRDTTGRIFEACFAAGLAATWISPDGRYVFEPVEAVGGPG